MSLRFDDFVCEIRTKAQSEAAKLAERMLQMMKEADPTLGVCEEATDMLREALFYMKNNQRISEMEISTDDREFGTKFDFFIGDSMIDGKCIHVCENSAVFR